MRQADRISFLFSGEKKTNNTIVILNEISSNYIIVFYSIMNCKRYYIENKLLMLNLGKKKSMFFLRFLG